MRKRVNNTKKELPEWRRFFHDFVLKLRNKQTCFNCGQKIEVDSLAVIVEDRTFACFDCVSRYYEKLKLTLHDNETIIYYEAYNLGHKLGSFFPGYLCRKLELKNGEPDPNFDRAVATRVACCRDCNATISYQVINALFGTTSMSIDEPMGFPLKGPCPKET